MQTKVKTAAEIVNIRESGRILATVLEILKKSVVPGMSTQDLDDIAARETEKLGGKPAFLGYQGFPAVLCVSLNDEVVHGIPSKDRIIQAGDIVSMDYGVIYNGMITDAARSVIAGGRATQKRHQELIDRTEASMYEGIAAVHDQVRTGDIGAAVQSVLDKYKYGIVRDLVGHGVGHHIHEDPNIPNYGRANTGPWRPLVVTALPSLMTAGRSSPQTAHGLRISKTRF
jgi:methionyl aminopeptidase